MPTSEAKSTAQEPQEPAETKPKRASTGPRNLTFPEDDRPFSEEVSTPAEDDLQADEGGQKARIGRGAATSRWVDYDTHELLQMISELEDERRWARLREGIWLALLIHILLISAITWVPRYIFHVPPVIDPFEAMKQRKDLTYLDLPPDVIKKFQPKVEVKPAPERQPRVDKKTLEALNKPAPPPPPPEPQPTPVPQPALTSPVPKVEPAPSEAPRPQAVPARPSFAMGSANPSDQLRDAMRGARSGPGATQMPLGGGQMQMHPGAGGGVQVLSDTQGVDFSSWLLRWHRETERTWDPLIPDEVNPPILKKGVVIIRFKVLPNGRLVEPNGVFLEGRSGDTGLDRAAWGALIGSNYPPLPKEFHGPYLELRAIFMYNTEPGR
ncbi:MAG: energy transducer TonB [Terracidiphilus sp.]